MSDYTKCDHILNCQRRISWCPHGVFQGPRGLRGLQGPMGPAGDRVSNFKAEALLPALFSMSAPIQNHMGLEALFNFSIICLSPGPPGIQRQAWHSWNHWEDSE